MPIDRRRVSGADQPSDPNRPRDVDTPLYARSTFARAGSDVPSFNDEGAISSGDSGCYAAERKTSAYYEALAGGKHAGLLRNYLDKPTTQIEHGISSIEKQIAEHQAKIRNPSAYIDNWASLDPRQREALLNSKWPGDIARQHEQLGILRGILGSR